ncbi:MULTISPECIES: prepilin-type N-terminal cleavage/methylation domain-containing protein [unclassified Legionella]|uniref:type IV pilus modification PilV family protein n=1 Tax=unclassified Legionella TaxID=2622702 RepID=UPI0010556C11|nr:MULTISPECIES: prepilin-type N-terminal cleavage/methylation domain-containing protein [unclassified Legionella]MDI9817604.1 prepilin-type N-terminal cleavage/methylation domain-containing protein [Legionella sp. PL877]
MRIYQGFSLTEVLIALLLISGTSLALLKQQSQVKQLLQDVLQRTLALILVDNNAERILAHQPLGKVQNPFEIEKKSDNQHVLVNISWGMSLSKDATCCRLQRKLLPS